jgi:hypothetical protein
MEPEEQNQFEPAPVQQELSVEESGGRLQQPHGLRSDGEALALHET